MKDDFEGLVGYFDSLEDLPRAIEEARAANLPDLEVYLPAGDRAVVDEAVRGSSLVPWVALPAALAGLGAGLFLTIWTSLDYPLITGGMPIVSLPPFLVVAVEVMLLFAGFGAVAGFLFLSRLPRLTPSPSYRRDLAVDRAALFIRCPPYGAPLRAETVLREAGAVEIRRVVSDDRSALAETR